MSTNFDLAPPPKTVNGLAAVPIDIQTINATLVFDAATSTALGDATLSYTVGPSTGNPIFDLRQEITSAWLDGVPFSATQLAHHTFGSASFTDLRVIEAVQSAGSVHTLRVQYPLATPNAQLGGSYLPALDWSAGPRLRFVLGLSDLNKARYLEAWIPCNLIFDQFALTLEIQIVNTMVAHSVISNGTVTVLGSNHWHIEFPSRYTALSPLLEVRASDTLVLQTDTTTLPVSGKTITLEAWKPAGSGIALTGQLNTLKTLLADNENSYGAYLHDHRFTAFFNGGGGMEYEGGTTTSTSALLHETFHSWFARGIKPASQADGWWDEAFTSFHDDGANDTQPFDFTSAPVLLCSRDPWQRNTPSNSYSDGARFWRGMAAMLGIAQLNTLMKELYLAYQGKPVSTAMIEEFLLSKSGNAQVVDAFHRFVYGLANPSSAPDLWLRDEIGDPGADAWGGAFWNSPDLWIRNADDGGTTHQSPEYGQDNWFYARVRNKAAAGTAQHFVVTFHAKGFAGTQFQYPSDFLPCTSARAAFDLAPGTTRIVKARWPRAQVPPAGTHTCLLASVITRSDHPIAGRHVWEHNNLAQKNLTIVDLLPNTFMILPIVVANWQLYLQSAFALELIRLRKSAMFAASVIHTTPELFRNAGIHSQPFNPFEHSSAVTHEPLTLECGAHLAHSRETQFGSILTSATPELIQRRFPQSWETTFPDKDNKQLVLELPPFNQVVVGLKITVPRDATPGKNIQLHFVQRSLTNKQIVGGVSVQVNVVKPDEFRAPSMAKVF